jgi:hypothetical protein
MTPAAGLCARSAKANICLDLAAKSREFWVTACLIELARELLNRAN